MLNDPDKVTKLLHTLPKSLDPLDLASALEHNNFEEVVTAIGINVERMKKLGSWKVQAATTVANRFLGSIRYE